MLVLSNFIDGHCRGLPISTKNSYFSLKFCHVSNPTLVETLLILHKVTPLRH